MIKLGGVVVLAVRGVMAEEKATAKMQVRKYEAVKAAYQAHERQQQEWREGNLTLMQKPKGCKDRGEDECRTCARSFEGQLLELDCGESGEFVISEVFDATWGEARDQPDVLFDPYPGMCRLPSINAGRMKMVTRTIVKQRMVG